MGDIRERMLATWAATLLQDTDSKGHYSSFFNIVCQEQLLQKQGGSVQDVVSHINTCLNSGKNRLEGLCLLDVTLRQCSTDVFSKNAGTWARLLLAALQSYDPAANQQLCCKVTAELLRHSTPFPELHRDLASTVIPQIITALLAAKQQWLAAAVQCITACVIHYPGPCGPPRGKIEGVIVPCLESDDAEVRQAAVKCYALLPRSGGGGNQGIKHTEAFTAQLSKVLGSLHSTLGELFQDLEHETYSRPEGGPTLYFPEVNSAEPARCCHLQARFSTLCAVLRQMLNQEFPAVVKLPLRDLLNLACRTLAVTPKQLLLRPTQEKIFLASVTPFLHQDVFKLLSVIITSVGSHLVPYCTIVNKLFVQTLNWSGTTQNMYGQDRPYGDLRRHVYQTFLTWLTELGCATGVEIHADSLLQHLVRDCTPELDTVKPQLMQPSSTKTDAPHGGGKKKRKHGGGDIGQISTQRKIDSEANSGLCLAALRAFNQLLMAVGPFMKPDHHKAVQDLCIPTLLRVGQDSSSRPIPYANPSCRGTLYTLLLTSVTSPHPRWPPATQCAVSIFSRGRLDENSQVSDLCRRALSMCENIIHPRAPSLCSPIELDASIISIHPAEATQPDTVQSGIQNGGVEMYRTLTIAAPRETEKRPAVDVEMEDPETVPFKMQKVESMEVEILGSSSSEEDSKEEEKQDRKEIEDPSKDAAQPSTSSAIILSPPESSDEDEQMIDLTYDSSDKNKSEEPSVQLSKNIEGEGGNQSEGRTEIVELEEDNGPDKDKGAGEENKEAETSKELVPENAGEGTSQEEDSSEKSKEGEDKKENTEKEVGVEEMLHDFVDAGPDSD